MQGIRPPLEAFAGNWRIARRVRDIRAGQIIRFDGQMSMTQNEDGLLYCETGTILAPGQAPLQGSRTYLWRMVGQDIAVFFEDGRAFHTIGPGAQPQAHHDCPPDAYDVAYDFTRWPQWSARWAVLGPRKDYVSLTGYQRF